MKKALILLIMMFSFLKIFAIDAAADDVLRQTGKLYVVLGVLLIIFVGILIFLLLLERKISKLENQLNH